MTAPTQPPQGLTAAQIATLLALVQAQAQVRQQLARAAIAAALAPLAGFTAWWDSTAVDRMITQVLRVVQPLQRQAARVTDGYLTNASTIISGRRKRAAGAVDITQLRRAMTEALADEILAGRRRVARVELGDTHAGPASTIDADPGFGLEDDREFADPAEAYGKVADNYRWQTTVMGDAPEKAQAKAAARIAQVAETDVTLAVRAQYQRTLEAHDATGYRRILHPELSETGPCGLCVVAADRLYRTKDLLPLHNRCVCEVLPVFGRVDPGVTLNGDDLAAIYQAAGGNTREHLRRVRVVLTEHGELGPLLADGDQHYRGPDEVARNYASRRRVREQAILDSLREIYEANQLRALRGDNVSKSLAWQAQRIDALERSLAKLR